MRCFPALVMIAAAGCGGSDLTLPNEGVAASIVVVTGDHQSAAIGSPLPDSLVVRVTDTRKQPVANQPVGFAVVAGGGSVSPASTTTNADGIARARWVMGPSAGAQQATATAIGNGAPKNLSVTFTATATASAPARIEAAAGNNQSSPAGSAVPTDPTVKVTDDRGNPVVGASVTFLVTSGGGAVNPSDPVSTNGSGLASVSWTLGPQAGPNTMSASVGGSGIAGNPVSFTATGTAGSAGRLVIVTQPPSTAQSGVALSPAPAIQLQDLNGNDVKQGGVAVLADIASGPAGGSITGASATTNGKGLATFNNLVLTGPAGQYTISFSGTNVTGVISTPVTLAAGGATKLSVLVPPSASAQTGEQFAQQPQIQLQDAAGNPVAQAGVNVVATLSDEPPGGGTLAGQVTVQTAADGIARFSNLSIKGAAGSYTLLFASGNLTSATAPVSIAKGATTTSLETAPNPSNVGQQVTLTAHVAVVAPAAGTPSGAVQFFDGLLPIGSDNLNGSGVATLQHAFLLPGQHQLRAQYAGDGAFTGSTSTQVTQVVNIVNQAPTAGNDSYSVNEDTPLVVNAPGVLGNDSDPNNDPITAVKLTNPANGTVTLNSDGSFTYTPAANFNGQDSFTYQASDGQLASSPATVAITVNAVNDAPSFAIPVTSDQASTTLPSQQTRTGWVTSISPGPPDEAGQTVSFTVTTDHDELFSAPPEIDPGGTLTYTPGLLATGTVTVTVVAHDSQGGSSAPQQFTITLSP